jgi:hypothetical protein
MNFRREMLKHQEIQETADKFEEGNRLFVYLLARDSIYTSYKILKQQKYLPQNVKTLS